VIQRMKELCSKNPKSIYRKDNRKDMYEFQDEDHQNELRVAKCVVSLWNKNQLGPGRPNGSRILITSKFTDRKKVLPTENFANQPTGAFGTGFLVQSPQRINNWIVTAGHCIRGSIPIEDIIVIFGFSYDNSDSNPCEVKNEDIYEVARVIRKEKNPDYAIIELKKSVDNQEVAMMNFEVPLDPEAELYMIGHPSGLPKKLSYGIVKNCNEHDFLAEVNAWKGNSGSPLFNTETHKVEGILVSGPGERMEETKRKFWFFFSESRYFSKPYTDTECENPLLGETCILAKCLKDNWDVDKAKSAERETGKEHL